MGRGARRRRLGLAGRLAADLGVILHPGETFRPTGAGHVRLAAVQPDDRIELVWTRAHDLVR